MTGYKQALDNGVLKNPKDISPEGKTFRNGDWQSLLDEGENPKGFTAFTPNGPSRVPADTLVHKDNFGKGENGDHYVWGWDTVPAVSVTTVSRKKKGA